MTDGQRLEPVDRHVVFARGGAQREQPLLDLLELARIVVGRAQRGVEMRRGRPRARRAPRRATSPPARSVAGAWAERRSSRRSAADRAGAGDCAPATASWASRRSPATFSAAIMAARRSASAVSSPARGASRVELLDRVAQPVGLALRPLDLGAMGGDARLRARGAASHSARHRRGLAVERAERVEQPAMGRDVDQRALVVLAVDLDQRRAERFIACTLTGWSLTKARVRPSANCTRRRISSSSAGMSLAAIRRAPMADNDIPAEDDADPAPRAARRRPHPRLRQRPAGERAGAESARRGAGRDPRPARRSRAGRRRRRIAGCSTRSAGSRTRRPAVERLWDARRDAQEAGRRASRRGRAARRARPTGCATRSRNSRRLAPEAGEETALAERRAAMMRAEKVAGDLRDAHEAVAGAASPVPALAAAMRRLERRGAQAPAWSSRR